MTIDTEALHSPLLRANIEMMTAARRVVWVMHHCLTIKLNPDISEAIYSGDAVYLDELRWDELREAIDKLEEIVGRPFRERDI